MPSGRTRPGSAGSGKANHPSLYSDAEEISGCSGSKKSTSSLVAGTTVRVIQKSNPAQSGPYGASGSSGYHLEEQGPHVVRTSSRLRAHTPRLIIIKYSSAAFQLDTDLKLDTVS